MICKVEIAKKALKDIEKLPVHIRDKLMYWLKAISEKGLQQVRIRSGLHDEPLAGKRVGQRSVRLSRSYRVIYVVIKEEKTIDQKEEYVRIEEVHKHRY